MSKSYNKAPNILTGKDLSYLKDIFGWNFNNYKFLEDALNFVENKEVSNIISNCSNFFYDNMTIVLNILEKGGNNE